MKNPRLIFFTIFLSLLSRIIFATPSSLFWTNCTTDVVETGYGQLNFDNYFRVWSHRGANPFLPLDIGLELGIFSWHDIAAEAGIDFLGGVNDPLYFNAKIAIEEDKLFSSAPSLSVGMFNVGVHSHVTDQNVIDVVIGKSLPKALGGRFFAGFFHGNKSLGKNRNGFMLAFQKKYCPAKDCCGVDYDKWAFSVDYASGKNAIGGGGAAITYYFAPQFYLQTGPVFFNSAKIYGPWKWSVQLYFDFSLFDPKP